MGSHAVGCGPGWGGTLLSVPTPSGFSSHPLKFQTPLSLARQAGTGPLWAGGGGHRLGGWFPGISGTDHLFFCPPPPSWCPQSGGQQGPTWLGETGAHWGRSLGSPPRASHTQLLWDPSLGPSKDLLPHHHPKTGRKEEDIRLETSLVVSGNDSPRAGGVGDRAFSRNPADSAQ